MDQDNSKGQDKRNWRERLGIGAQPPKELPKIADGYRKDLPEASSSRATPGAAKPAPRPTAAAVRPAPMAPRANPKPIAPVAPDKLAERLRTQREASTRLAEQRVQVAKQRADQPIAAPPVAPIATAAPKAPGAKPKFTFAEEGEAKPVAAAPRPAAAPQVAPPKVAAPVQPQMPPARPPLGGMPANTPVFTPRPPQPTFQPQQQPQQQNGYPPQQQAPLGYPQQTYPGGFAQQPVPPYRPIDPNTGYAPQPGFGQNLPPRGFNLPPQQNGYAPQQQPPMQRPLMPQQRPMAPAPQYQPQAEFAPAPSPAFANPPRNARPPMRAPVGPTLGEESFEQEYEGEDVLASPRAAARRPSTTDYQQAYREAEYGYEEEAPPSKAPWVLAGLVLLSLLVAGAGVWLYQTRLKPVLNGQQTSQEVPAVVAPDAPAKVEPEKSNSDATAQGSTPAEVPAPTKKQIYDRIVGDQEITGDQVAPASEQPAAIPEPAPETGAAGEGTAITPPAATEGEAAPLPIPPPPGGTGDQQGALDLKTDPSSEISTPAAGESQAAVAAQEGADTLAPNKADASTVSPTRSIAAPVPGEVVAESSEPVIAPEKPAEQSEAISDSEPAPVVKKKLLPKKPAAEKKLAEKSLGAKPVVLVPPSKKTKAPRVAADQDNVASLSEPSTSANGGIYGDDVATGGVTTSAQPIEEPVAEAPKKKKTLSDFFNGDDDATTPPPPAAKQVAVLEPPPPEPVQAKKPALIAPAPEQQASTVGGFVVQLASFTSKAEANSEYGRIKGKSGGALNGLSPLISEAQVGGSTRFRLSVGPVASSAEANGVCSKLFAAGVRDCLVKRR
jgi:hypothetical protein